MSDPTGAPRELTAESERLLFAAIESHTESGMDVCVHPADAALSLRILHLESELARLTSERDAARAACSDLIDAGYDALDGKAYYLDKLVTALADTSRLLADNQVER